MSVSRQELIQEAKRRHNPDLDYRRAVVELQAHEMSDTFLARLLAERLESSQEWYAVRLERLKQLGKEKGCWNEMAAIIANGTATAEEPPNYAQLVNFAKHDAETLRDVLLRTAASLMAAISLLERTPRSRKLAPSDKMFEEMLEDYRRALARARKALSGSPK